MKKICQPFGLTGSSGDRLISLFFFFFMSIYLTVNQSITNGNNVSWKIPKTFQPLMLTKEKFQPLIFYEITYEISISNKLCN